MWQCVFVAMDATLVAFATAQDNGCTEENGNWYCNEVSAVTYTGFGSAGTYDQVSSMANGQCNFAPLHIHGGMAPLDGEVSWHFRGPMHLKQFAFYTPGSNVTSRPKRDNLHRPTSQQRRGGHGHIHKHVKGRAIEPVKQDENDKRDIGDWVTATMNGKVVSWINKYHGGAANATAAPVPASSAAPARSNAAPTALVTAAALPPVLNVGAGRWGRQAYYNAEKRSVEGLVFLNNKGGAGSGVFDTTWGLSLLYASADGKTGSANPQTLANTLLEDNTEIAIFTSTPCKGSNCAGTSRPGSVAYEGFNGASKLFLLEFNMPLSGQKGFNADMPAAWILNAQIPRTNQYSACSCWQSGCGEWDIFEVLDSGNTKCKSTFHAGLGKGDGASEWFKRPVDKPIKVAVLFDGSLPRGEGHIVVLPDDTLFSDVMVDSLLSSLLRTVVGTTKIFPLAG